MKVYKTEGISKLRLLENLAITWSMLYRHSLREHYVSCDFYFLNGLKMVFEWLETKSKNLLRKSITHKFLGGIILFGKHRTIKVEGYDPDDPCVAAEVKDIKENVW